MPRPFYASELVGETLIWLVELTWAGRTFRFASEPHTSTDANGDTLQYPGELRGLEFEREFDLWSESPAASEVSLEVMFPGDIDVADMVTKGHDLAAARGEVALTVAGQAYEDRHRLVTGRLYAPEYGAADDGVAFTIQENPYDDRAVIPPYAHRVTTETWSGRGEDYEGRIYPRVYGTPGIYTDAAGVSATTKGSPGYAVGPDTPGGKILVAGHRVKATALTIHDATDETSGSYAVQYQDDGLGQEVAYCQVSSAVTYNKNHIYWVQWDGGGLPNVRNDGEITGAAEILLDLLRRSSITVDLGRFRAAWDVLNVYKFSGYVDSNTTPWNIARDHILPFIPASLVSTESGLGPVVWRLDATTNDAVAHLTEGPGLVREGRVTYRNLEIANAIRLEFAKDSATGEFQRSVTVTGADTLARDEFTTLQTRTSFRRYGEQAMSRQAHWIYDAGTAAQVALDLSRLHAARPRAVTYTATGDLAWLAPGDVVTITDAELAFTDQVAFVGSVKFAGDLVVLDLVLLEDLARDVRVAA